MTIAKICNPTCLALTDGDDKAVELLVENLKSNQLVDDESSNVQATNMIWQQERSNEFDDWCILNWGCVWSNPDEKVVFDVIIAGDVLYKQELPVLFFATAKTYLCSTGTMFLCHVPRANVTHELVIEAAKQAGFVIEPVDTERFQIQGCPMDDLTRARIYRLRLNTNVP